MQDLTQNPWWSYLDESQQDLLIQSIELLKREQLSEAQYHDYAFIVFPAAKAYEGFLKKLFLGLGLISEEQYKGRHFRIGKALNPNLESHIKDQDWIVENLRSECSDQLPEVLWEAWRLSRNSVFHWFPDHQNFITLSEARERIELIINAIDTSFKECRINK